MIIWTNCSWEVPFPHAVKTIYSKFNGEGTDPRFVKLKPIFRCSRLRTANTQRYPVFIFNIMTWQLFKFNTVQFYEKIVQCVQYCDKLKSRIGCLFKFITVLFWMNFLALPVVRSGIMNLWSTFKTIHFVLVESKN